MKTKVLVKLVYTVKIVIMCYITIAKRMRGILQRGSERTKNEKIDPTQNGLTMASYYLQDLISRGKLPKSDKTILTNARKRILKIRQKYTEKVK